MFAGVFTATTVAVGGGVGAGLAAVDEPPLPQPIKVLLNMAVARHNAILFITNSFLRFFIWTADTNVSLINRILIRLKSGVEHGEPFQVNAMTMHWLSLSVETRNAIFNAIPY